MIFSPRLRILLGGLGRGRGTSAQHSQGVDGPAVGVGDRQLDHGQLGQQEDQQPHFDIEDLWEPALAADGVPR